ncbi:hypothetical protein, partial [Stutzerimonas stutzeri]|uniref:hypothetical protein n=1 Tax=Stutzerimonas stutzeri TaxID=316 RepID=UPI00195529DE
GCSWFAVTDGCASGDSIIRKAIRRTAGGHKQQNAPHEGEAFSLQRRIQQVRGERRITLR